MTYSVGIFKNKKGRILIVPSGFDKQGLRRSLDVFKILEESYDIKILGQAIRDSLLISKNSPIIEDVNALGNVFETATGIKGWSKFSKEHIHVSGSWNPESGYIFAPLKRVRGGGYLGEKGDPVIELGLDSSDEEIGEAVLKAFSCLE